MLLSLNVIFTDVTAWKMQQFLQQKHSRCVILFYSQQETEILLKLYLEAWKCQHPHLG